MDKRETIQIMAVLKEAYPYYYRDKAKEEITIAVNLWQEMFAEDDFNFVKAAVKAHIATDTKGFPPVIGQIKSQLGKLTQPEQMTEQEAWTLVSKAINNGYYNATKEFEKLPPIVQKVVCSPSQLREWSQMDIKTVQSVVSSNFMRSYTVNAEREKEYQALPGDVKQLISNVTTKLLENKGVK